MRFPFSGKRRGVEAIPYDPARQRPAVRRSICTGEMTGGFVDRNTGKFQEYLLLEGEDGLRSFCEGVGVDPSEIRTIY